METTVMDGNDLTTAAGVTEHMKKTTSRNDWNIRCDQIKTANGGDYPEFWYETVIASGLYSRIMGGIDMGIMTT